jgi:hypothetical protein
VIEEQGVFNAKILPYLKYRLQKVGKIWFMGVNIRVILNANSQSKR